MCVVCGCCFQIALGTVTNVEEAVKWLSYTYFYVRMRANPLAYGINHKTYQVRDHRSYFEKFREALYEYVTNNSNRKGNS